MNLWIYSRLSKIPIAHLFLYLTLLSFGSLSIFILPIFGETRPYFHDATAEMGVNFHHVNGFSPQHHIVETMGSGGALFDYDNDGDLDLYLVQGNYLYKSDSNIRNRFYRNDGNRFVEVTTLAGIGDAGYGMGAVAADYDDDGFLDLYATNFGKNVLYRNNGDGTFSDATDQAAVSCPLLSSSAAFADYDRDGDLDLYVCNYAEYSLATEKPCYFRDIRIYCGPNEYRGISDALYKNNGDGSFSNVAKESGVYEPTTRGLGVVFTDVNDDGWLDIYVANDMTPNTIFINQQNATFFEEGVLRGVAYNDDGIANGSMGVDSADYDNDGDFDLWVTNFSLEANCLMQNDGKGFFHDATFDVGLAEPSFYMLGFGTRFLDFDNDGWLDLLVGNGHIWENVEQIDPTLSYPQPVQLFRNRGGNFSDITAEAGLNEKSYVVRGMIFGDIDNDGDADVVLCQSNRPTVILHNEVGSQRSWIMLKLIGLGKNRDAIGAKVRLVANGAVQTREVICGASYLSGNDLRLLFGLGEAESVERLEIRWPDGSVQVMDNLPARQLILIRKKD